MAKPFNPIFKNVGYTPKKKEMPPEIEVGLKPCIVCGKTISDGYYGRYEKGGVCSKVCNTTQSLKPKYPDHPAEDFERLHKL